MISNALMLFACDCIEHILPSLKDSRLKYIIGIARQFFEGETTKAELNDAQKLAEAIYSSIFEQGFVGGMGGATIWSAKLDVIYATILITTEIKNCSDAMNLSQLVARYIFWAAVQNTAGTYLLNNPKQYNRAIEVSVQTQLGEYQWQMKRLMQYLIDSKGMIASSP